MIKFDYFVDQTPSHEDAGVAYPRSGGESRVSHRKSGATDYPLRPYKSFLESCSLVPVLKICSDYFLKGFEPS